MAIITEIQEPSLQRLALVFHLLGLRSSGPKLEDLVLYHPIQEVTELWLGPLGNCFRPETSATPVASRWFWCSTQTAALSHMVSF